jgi:hypothetical protein
MDRRLKYLSPVLLLIAFRAAKHTYCDTSCWKVFKRPSRVVNDSDLGLIYRQPRTDRVWHTVQNIHRGAKLVCELVTQAVNCQKELWMMRIIFQLLPQPGNVNIYSACRWHGVIAPDFVEQLVS